MLLDSSVAYHAFEKQQMTYEGALAVVNMAYDDQVKMWLLATQFIPVRSNIYVYAEAPIT